MWQESNSGNSYCEKHQRAASGFEGPTNALRGVISFRSERSLQLTARKTAPSTTTPKTILPATRMHLKGRYPRACREEPRPAVALNGRLWRRTQHTAPGFQPTELKADERVLGCEELGEKGHRQSYGSQGRARTDDTSTNLNLTPRPAVPCISEFTNICNLNGKWM